MVDSARFPNPKSKIANPKSIRPRPDSNGRPPPSQSGVLNSTELRGPSPPTPSPALRARGRYHPLTSSPHHYSQGRGRTSINLLGLYVQSVGCCLYTTCDQEYTSTRTPPRGVEPLCVRLPFRLVRSQRGYDGTNTKMGARGIEPRSSG